MGNLLKLKSIRVVLAISIFGSVVFFQNCGSKFQVLNPEFLQISSQASSNSLLAFEQQKSLLILSQNCKACHQDQSLGGVSNILDIDKLVASGLIIPGKPDTSKLMIAINNNSMPPSGALSATDKNILQNWILLLGNQSALNPAPVDLTFNINIPLILCPFVLVLKN